MLIFCFVISDGYYEWHAQSKEGPLRNLFGKIVCRKCHPRCEICSSYGFHIQICPKCAGYKSYDVCEDECPLDHYANEELRECFKCHKECRGCTGSTEADCVQCRNFKLFTGDASENSTQFNCTSDCPLGFPYKRYEFGPYCSESIQQASLHENKGKQIILSIIVIVVVFTICGLVFVSFICYRRMKAKDEAVKMTRVLAGCEEPLCERLRPSNVGPNLTKLRIVKEGELRRGGILGMGAFGRVFKGVWIPENENVKIPVAIKVLTEISGAQSSKEFLDEAYIMASVEHPNLLKLLAVCMTSQMMLITQLMPLGCLLDYVRNNRDKIGSKALLNWSTQIAKGMAYLEERRLVHRDLAARNVLVQTPSMVKITDFGLAKLLDVDSDEYKAPGGKMPIKWLALECIRNRVFTSKSDVWSFGVTIWELLTFGARPYENTPAKDVPELIEIGHKLPQPEICSLDIYCMLLACWHVDADSRPHFKELAEQFAQKASDPGRYLVITGDKFMRLPSYTSQDEKDLIRTLAPVDGPESIVEADEYLQPKIRSSTFVNQTSVDHFDDQIPNPIRYCSDPLKQHNSNSIGDDETDLSFCNQHLNYKNHHYNNSASLPRRSQHRDNGIGVGVGGLRLDLPLDEDDYLMPTNPNSVAGPSGAAYMDLINVPVAASSVDNPEYLLGATQKETKPFRYLSDQRAKSADNLECPTVLPLISSNSLTSTTLPDSTAPTQTIGIPISPIEMKLSGTGTEESSQSSEHEYYNDFQRELQPLHRNETTV